MERLAELNAMLNMDEKGRNLLADEGIGKPEVMYQRNVRTESQTVFIKRLFWKD